MLTDRNQEKPSAGTESAPSTPVPGDKVRLLAMKSVPPQLYAHFCVLKTRMNLSGCDDLTVLHVCQTPDGRTECSFMEIAGQWDSRILESAPSPEADLTPLSPLYAPGRFP